MSTIAPRTGLAVPQRGQLDWDDEIIAWCTRLDTYSVYTDKTATITARQTFADAVHSGAAPVFRSSFLFDGTPNSDTASVGFLSAPTATTGDGDPCIDLTVTGCTGQETTGATGQTAGGGGDISLYGGAGGAAPSGSTTGNGGDVLLQAGAPGGGGGTAGDRGIVELIGRFASLTARLQLAAASQPVQADDTVLAITLGGIPVSLILLSSDSATATSRTIVMPTATRSGEVVILIVIQQAVELVDDSLVDGGSGHCRLASTWTATINDSIVLCSIPNGADFDWIELCRSAN